MSYELDNGLEDLHRILGDLQQLRGLMLHGAIYADRMARDCGTQLEHLNPDIVPVGVSQLGSDCLRLAADSYVAGSRQVRQASAAVVGAVLKMVEDCGEYYLP